MAFPDLAFEVESEAAGDDRGGQTGVWAPHRLNGMWVRCEACGEMVQARPDGGCRCGAALPATPRYW